MAEAVKLFGFRNRAAAQLEEERQTLLSGLSETKRQINQAYASFNGTDDPDLIESYVYEINSLQSRYSYLLRRVRELEPGAARE